MMVIQKLGESPLMVCQLVWYHGGSKFAKLKLETKEEICQKARRLLDKLAAATNFCHL